MVSLVSWLAECRMATLVAHAKISVSRILYLSRISTCRIIMYMYLLLVLVCLWNKHCTVDQKNDNFFIILLHTQGSTLRVNLWP